MFRLKLSEKKSTTFFTLVHINNSLLCHCIVLQLFLTRKYDCQKLHTIPETGKYSVLHGNLLGLNNDDALWWL